MQSAGRGCASSTGAAHHMTSHGSDVTPPCGLAQELWGEAARMLAKAVNDDTFVSLEGKSKHQLWLELCDIITRHPRDVTALKVDAILRSGIRKFTDEVGLFLSNFSHLLQVSPKVGQNKKEKGLWMQLARPDPAVAAFPILFRRVPPPKEIAIHFGHYFAT